MEPAYTPKQGQYLAFIHHYTQVNRQPPAEADIQQFFRVSAPTVHQMILNLEARGLLARTPGKPRSLRVLVPSGTLSELTSPGTSPQERPTEGEAGAREARTTKKRGPKAAQRSSPLQQLKEGEAAALFRSLVEKHPELSAEAETLARVRSGSPRGEEAGDFGLRRRNSFSSSRLGGHGPIEWAFRR